MQSRRKFLNLGHRTRAGGRIHVEVLDQDGSVARDHGWHHNLILDTGLDYFCTGSTSLIARITTCTAGTGTTPVKATPNGTYAQTGNTVTRSTGTGTFSAGDVGKRIKFGSGEQAKITAFTSSTEVDVDVSQTVAAAALDVFNTDDTGLETYVVGTTTLSAEPSANVTTFDSGTGDVTHQKAWIFPAEVSAQNYTEIGFASNTGAGVDAFSRIVLASAASVGIGQQLRVTYVLTLEEDGPITLTNSALSITGWPYSYDISAISSTASDFTVTTATDHHYEVGGEINIAGALPTKTTITAISSTASDFTVTAAGHGKVASDSIEIEDCSVGAYNGTWTVASTTTNTITVTSAINPGAASDGTVRLSTPGTWYNGTWTVASIPATNQVTITSAINPVAAGDDGTVENNTDADVLHPYYGYVGHNENVGGSNFAESRLYEGDRIDAYLIRDGDALTPSAFPWEYTSTPTGDSASSTTTSTSGYVAGSGTRVCTATWAIDNGNHDDIRQLAIFFHANTKKWLGLFIDFDELQRKDSGFELVMTFTRQFEAVLA